MVAKKCWHDKARERPEIKDVLQELVQTAVGECTRDTCSSFHSE